LPDEIYLIYKAKTEFREGYNDGNIEQVLSVFDAKMIEMSQDELTGFAEGGLRKLRARLTALFAEYHVKMVPIIIDVVVKGDFAYDFGWHEAILTPKLGGPPILQRFRYLEHWKKNPAGEWRIAFLVTNEDQKEAFNGMEPKWFIGEESEAMPQGTTLVRCP
jgi:ketosteroid isomerase-like protein